MSCFWIHSMILIPGFFVLFGFEGVSGDLWFRTAAGLSSDTMVAVRLAVKNRKLLMFRYHTASEEEQAEGGSCHSNLLKYTAVRSKRLSSI